MDPSSLDQQQNQPDDTQQPILQNDLPSPTDPVQPVAPQAPPVVDSPDDTPSPAPAVGDVTSPDQSVTPIQSDTEVVPEVNSSLDQPVSPVESVDTTATSEAPSAAPVDGEPTPADNTVESPTADQNQQFGAF